MVTRFKLLMKDGTVPASFMCPNCTVLSRKTSDDSVSRGIGYFVRLLYFRSIRERHISMPSFSNERAGSLVISECAQLQW